MFGFALCSLKILSPLLLQKEKSHNTYTKESKLGVTTEEKGLVSVSSPLHNHDSAYANAPVSFDCRRHYHNSSCMYVY